MKLSALLDGLDGVTPPVGDEDPTITSLALNSRDVTPGALFAALPGTATDGSRFVPQALERGAAAILCDADHPVQADAPVVAAVNPRRTFAQMAGRFYARPKHVLAVTGTNGKTSVAAFTQQILTACGVRCVTVGTLGITHPDGRVEPSLTTPDTATLHRSLATMANEGVEAVALEASSHGLAQHRLDGVPLAAAAFTNITQDHLDYHETFEAYLQAKLRIFELLADCAPAVIEAHAPGADRAIAHAKSLGLRVVTVGEGGADFCARGVTADGLDQSFALVTQAGQYPVTLPLPGRFQVSNALVALALAISTGVDEAAAVAALDTLRAPPGRLEPVGTTRAGAPVFVDYAHTPDSLRVALATLRPLAANRLHVVFGAGGDRDRGKRPLMGEAARAGADRIIVTDDNPRGEDPAAIRAAILAAVPNAEEIGDRAAAIRAAIGSLKAGDVLLIAGKGHETGQTVNGVTTPFSDHEVARAVLAEEAAS